MTAEEAFAEWLAGDTSVPFMWYGDDLAKLRRATMRVVESGYPASIAGAWAGLGLADPEAAGLSEADFYQYLGAAEFVRRLVAADPAAKAAIFAALSKQGTA